MRPAILLHPVLALLSEIGLLAAAIAIPLLTTAPTALRIAGAALLPALVIVVWGALLAPRASRRLPPRARLLTESVLFGLAVVGLALVGATLAAVLLTVVAGAGLVLGAALGRP